MKRLAEIALQETGISNLKNKKVNQLSGDRNSGYQLLEQS